MNKYENYENLSVKLDANGILQITFDNVESYNSLNLNAHNELTYIWQTIDRDDDVKVVILSGKGKAFSAGGDFQMIEDIIQSDKIRSQAWKEAKDLVYNIINCSKPLVSAINGPAVGAGLVAALLADISVAGRSAKILDGHIRLGVAAGDAAVINWPLLCGMAKAKYHLLLNKPIDGTEAERIGLVSLCVEDEVLSNTVQEIANKLVVSSQPAIRWTKYALNNWYRMAGPSFDVSTALEMLGFTMSDAKEGLTSLKEKREPHFGG